MNLFDKFNLELKTISKLFKLEIKNLKKSKSKIKELSKNGLLLENYPELQNDKDFVLIAVRQNGLALQFASEELRSDKEVVLEAVNENGFALQFASEELKENKDVVLVAVNENGEVSEIISEELRGDKDVKFEVNKQFEIFLNNCRK